MTNLTVRFADKPMARRRILYIHRRGVRGGSVISLLKLVEHLDRSLYDPVILFYDASSPYIKHFEKLGAEVIILNSHQPPEQSNLEQLCLGNTLENYSLAAAQFYRFFKSIYRWLRRDLARAWRIKRIITHNQIDLVHHNQWGQENVTAAWLAGTPQICHVRALGKVGPVDRWLSRYVATFIYVSSALAAYFEAQGLPPGKSRIILNGVTVEEFTVKQDIALLRPELGLQSTDVVVGNVGRLDWWKGHDIFLRAIAEIRPGSSLTLHYLADLGLVDPAQPFELQVSLNGVAIFRTILTNFDEQRLNIPLPEPWPGRTRGGRPEILLRSRGECSVGSFSTLKILADSFLTLNYRANMPQFDLANYPSPIYEQTFFPQSAFLVLPNQPSQLTIAGALSLGARLGDLTNNRLILTTTTATALNPANLPDEHLIIVGTPENNSLLSELNNSLHLPVPFQQRRLQLTGLGPESIVPGAPLTYTLYLTNTQAISASNLKLTVPLPYPREQVSCQPGCQRLNNSLLWNIETLAPAATTAMTLSFAYPLAAAVEPVNLAYELVQNQKIINAGHWPNPLELSQPTPASRFFFVSDGRAVPETDGVIQLLHSPRRFDRALLLVTGLTDEAVYKAERALGISPDLLGMTGQTALVQTILDVGTTRPELPQSFTLADLGYQDRVVTNITRQDILYRFDLPPNWALTPEAGVRFIFSHSLLLDPARSSITLFFNNTPIASVALDETNAFTGQLNVLLPPEKAKPGQLNSLVARIELNLLNPCADASSDLAWLNLSAASAGGQECAALRQSLHQHPGPCPSVAAGLCGLSIQ